jgi:hypothetical protein
MNTNVKSAHFLANFAREAMLAHGQAARSSTSARSAAFALRT